MKKTQSNIKSEATEKKTHKYVYLSIRAESKGFLARGVAFSIS